MINKIHSFILFVSIVANAYTSNATNTMNDALDNEIKYLEKGIQKKERIKNHQFYIRGDLGLVKLGKNLESKKLFGKNIGAKNFDSAIVYSLGLGYRITNNINSDVTYSNDQVFKHYKDIQNTKYQQKVKLNSLMINLYTNLLSKDKLSLYIGAGIGGSRIKLFDVSRQTSGLSIAFDNETKNNISYSLMSGVSMKINDNNMLNIGYKYHYHGIINGFGNYKMSTKNIKKEGKYKNKDKFTICTHSLMVGWQYNLPLR